MERRIPDNAGAVSAEQIAAVARDLRDFMARWKVKQRYVGKAVGYSPTVISEFLAGTYSGDSDRVAAQLDRWMSDEEVRRSEPKTAKFVWTNVAQKIRDTAYFCLKRRKLVLIYSADGSGIGKTTTLKQLAGNPDDERLVLVTLDAVDATPTALLSKLCRALKVTPAIANSETFARLVHAILEQDLLLMIDEIHSLRGARGDKPFYLLANLYDATHVAQLWVGTSDMWAYLQRQQMRHGDASLAQIRRRIFPRLDLMEQSRGGGGGGEPLVSIDQVREIFSTNPAKLTNASAQLIYRLVALPDSGGLGLAVQLVEYATYMASKMSAPSIDVPLLQLALRVGLSNRQAEILFQITAEPVAIAKAG